MQYVILDNEKRATHGFKDGVGAKKWDEVKKIITDKWKSER